MRKATPQLVPQTPTPKRLSRAQPSDPGMAGGIRWFKPQVQRLRPQLSKRPRHRHNRTGPALESGGVGVREFQGDDVGQVLRLLARQAKVNMVVSEAVTGTVTMRLEDVTALQAISIIVKAKGLFMDKIDNVYYIKTPAERTAEPTESDSYQFSYARAKEIAPLIASQLASKHPPQIDERTNTIFSGKPAATSTTFAKCLPKSTSRPGRS